jgi:hypothetical protein
MRNRSGAHQAPVPFEAPFFPGVYRTTVAPANMRVCTAQAPCPDFMCAGHAHTGKFLCGVLVRQPACAVDIPARCWQGIHSPRERPACSR